MSPEKDTADLCQLSVTDLSPAEQQSCLDNTVKYRYCPCMQAGVCNDILWAAEEEVFLERCLACSP